MFPFPAHQTGRVHFEHPAFRLDSPQHPRKRPHDLMTSDGTEDAPFALRHSWVERSSVLRDVVDSSSITALFPLSPAHQKQGPFPPPALPGLNGRTALSAFRADHHPIDDVEGATFARPGSPPITQITFLACRAQYPGGPNRCLSVSSLFARPSPVNRRVGIHDFTSKEHS